MQISNLHFAICNLQFAFLTADIRATELWTRNKMTNLIEPRTLKGFRDYPPELMIPREHLLEKTRQVYRSYGFVPIDTPALEYTEILLGKMDDEAEMRKIIYRFPDRGR